MRLTRARGAALLVGSVATVCAFVLGEVAGGAVPAGAVAATVAIVEAVGGFLVLLGLVAAGRPRRPFPGLTVPGHVGVLAVFLALVVATILPWAVAGGLGVTSRLGPGARILCSARASRHAR